MFRESVRNLLLLFTIVVICLISSSSLAQTVDPREKTLVVGYDDYNIDFDKDLWGKISEKSGFHFDYVKYDDIGTMIDDVQAGKLDIAMGGISITPEREQVVDFSKPYLNTGLKIAVANQERETSFFSLITDTTFIKEFISSIFSKQVMVIFFWFCIFILVSAHIVWLAEKDSFGKVPEEDEAGEIDESYLAGIGEAIYFCIVTSSTVGYGDFTCKRVIGKICSVGVIFTGVAFFANLTGYIAAERTVEIVNSAEIENFKDLENKVVATRAGTSTSKDKLNEVGAKVKEIPGEEDWIEEATELLKTGKIEAIVWDSPLIDQIEDPKIKKIDKMFYQQYYGFCMQEDSPVEESLNYSLLSILNTEDYDALIKKHYNRQR